MPRAATACYHSCRGTYREHVEDTFKFDGKTLATIAIWVVATPTLIYTTMIKEYNKADDQAGRCALWPLP